MPVPVLTFETPKSIISCVSLGASAPSVGQYVIILSDVAIDVVNIKLRLSPLSPGRFPRRRKHPCLALCTDHEPVCKPSYKKIPDTEKHGTYYGRINANDGVRLSNDVGGILKCP